MAKEPRYILDISAMAKEIGVTPHTILFHLSLHERPKKTTAEQLAHRYKRQNGMDQIFTLLKLATFYIKRE